MKKQVFALVLAFAVCACNNEKAADKSTETIVKSAGIENKELPPVAFADARYTEMGKRMMQLFADGSIDAWAENLTDDAVYVYSGGDSISGKKAITDYWKNRRAKYVQSINMTDAVWLPVVVNQSQTGHDRPGVWILNWSMVHATYRNGKTLNFWAHQDMHCNNADKVDRVVMYMDRAPINEAIKDIK